MTSVDSHFIVETPRLRLREFTPADATALHAVLGDAEVMRYSLSGPRTLAQVAQGIGEYQTHYQDGLGFWAVILKQSNTLIGFCGLKPLDVDGERELELGYRLAHAYWGQGFATEAATAVCRHAFATLHVARIVAAIDDANIASRRVIEKLGMKFERPYDYKGIATRLYALAAPSVRA